MKTVRLTMLAALSLTFASGCLEGDPNPVAQGTSSGMITPGTSGGTSGLPTVQPGTACSQGSTAAVNVTFRNNSDRSIDLFWVDYQCMEVRYSTLSPGASRTQPTFVAHPWRLRDTLTGALYKEFVAPSVLPTEVTVP